MTTITSNITGAIAGNSYSKIVFLGHSYFASFDGIKRINVIKGGNCDIVNSAIFGQRYDEMDARFANDVSAHSPDLVVLSGPVTDIKNGDSFATIKTRFLSIKSKVAAIGADFMTVEPSPWGGTGTPPDGWTEAKQVVHDAWLDYLSTQEVPYAKVYDALEDPANADQLLPAYTTDKLHLDPAGYAVWSPIVATLFEVSGKSPRTQEYTIIDTFSDLAPQKLQNRICDRDASLLGWTDDSDGSIELTGNNTIHFPTAVGTAVRVYKDVPSRDGTIEIEVKWPNDASEDGYLFGARYQDVDNFVFITVLPDSVVMRNRIAGVNNAVGTDLTGLTGFGGQTINLKLVFSGADITFEFNDDPTKTITYDSLAAGNTAKLAFVSLKETFHEVGNFRYIV